MLAADLDRGLGVVHGVGDHLEVLVEADDRGERVGEDLVVVADQQRDRGRAHPRASPSSAAAGCGASYLRSVQLSTESVPGVRRPGPGDEQAEAGTSHLLVARGAPVRERREHLLSLVLRDAGPSVGHLEIASSPSTPERDHDRLLPGENSPAFSHDLSHDLDEPAVVALDRDVDVELELDRPIGVEPAAARTPSRTTAARSAVPGLHRSTPADSFIASDAWSTTSSMRSASCSISSRNSTLLVVAQARRSGRAIVAARPLIVVIGPRSSCATIETSSARLRASSPAAHVGV